MIYINKQLKLYLLGFVTAYSLLPFSDMLVQLSQKGVEYLANIINYKEAQLQTEIAELQYYVDHIEECNFEEVKNPIGFSHND